MCRCRCLVCVSVSGWCVGVCGWHVSVVGVCWCVSVTMVGVCWLVHWCVLISFGWCVSVCGVCVLTCVAICVGCVFGVVVYVCWCILKLVFFPSVSSPPPVIVETIWHVAPTRAEGLFAVDTKV